MKRIIIVCLAFILSVATAPARADGIFYATDFDTAVFDPGVMIGFNATVTCGAGGKVFAWFHGQSIAEPGGAASLRLRYDSGPPGPPVRSEPKRGNSMSRPIENSVPGWLVPFSLAGFFTCPPGLLMWVDGNPMAEVITSGFSGKAHFNNLQLILSSP